MERLDQATQEALARANINTRRVVAIALTHSSFANDYRFCEFDRDITIDSGVYKAASLGIGQSSQNGEPGSTTTVIIDGVVSDLPFYVTQALRGLETIKAYIGYFMLEVDTLTPSDFYQVLPLEVQACSSATNNAITLTLGYLTAANRAFPNVYYNATDFPQLYR